VGVRRVEKLFVFMCDVHACMKKGKAGIEKNLTRDAARFFYCVSERFLLVMKAEKLVSSNIIFGVVPLELLKRFLWPEILQNTRASPLNKLKLSTDVIDCTTVYQHLKFSLCSEKKGPS
jgi:hypothetical protein